MTSEFNAKLVSLAASIERMGSDAYANGYRAGREAGLREAERLAEDAALCASDGDGAHTELKALAAAIRALIEKEPT